MVARTDRTYDVVLLGATGFTGRLVARYLADHAPAGLTWAVAGRNRDRLTAVRDSLRSRVPVGSPVAPADEVDLLPADVGDEASLRRIAEHTRVLVTTVGPYVLHGHPVVAACAAAGTDYLDLSGEPEFVDAAYLRHHELAASTGARLVHAAGFDSVPYDLGAYFTVGQLPEGVPLQLAAYLRVAGRVSGGTFASVLTALSRPRGNLRTARRRHAVEPRTTGRRVRSGPGVPGRDPVDGGWALPMPTLDPQIVGRSARALERYGPDFRYDQRVTVGGLPVALGLPAGLAALAVAAQVPPARRALTSRLASGDGPSPERRAGSWFTVTFVGEGGGRRVITRVSGGDPGYDETAHMLGESALCLALDDGLPDVAGQVTTAQAMGDALLERLRTTGMRFEVLA